MARYSKPKQKAKTTTVIVLSIGIVAPSIVLNDNSQYLLFSLLFWFWVSSQSHCILRELQHSSTVQMSAYARANARIANEKNKRKIAMRASRGLK